jgi:hypothetical protein
MSDRTEESYEDQVRERMALLRDEHPDGNYPSAYYEHPLGECVECDAIQRLETEDAGEAASG